MPDTEYIDDEYEENHTFYEPEEECSRRYCISLCELYNKKIHGNENSDVLYHYLVYCRFKNLHMNSVNEVINTINNEYSRLNNKKHDIFRNYRHIITRENYIKPEIIEGIYLNTGHFIAILKTFWLRLIQRKWKNIMKERENIFKKRCNQNSLRHREFTGKWPEDCLRIPQLKGMLSNLKFNDVW